MLARLDLIDIINHQRFKTASDDDLENLIQLAMRVVMKYKPNAKVLFTSNKQGAVTHAAVYDAQLTLNERGQFKPISQHAPQLLSRKVEWKLAHYSLEQKRLFYLWMDALVTISRMNAELEDEMLSSIQWHSKCIH